MLRIVIGQPSDIFGPSSGRLRVYLGLSSGRPRTYIGPSSGRLRIYLGLSSGSPRIYSARRRDVLGYTLGCHRDALGHTSARRRDVFGYTLGPHRAALGYTSTRCRAALRYTSACRRAISRFGGETDRDLTRRITSVELRTTRPLVFIVVNFLSKVDGKSTHVPYRDSKLTRLLQGLKIVQRDPDQSRFLETGLPYPPLVLRFGLGLT